VSRRAALAVARRKTDTLPRRGRTVVEGRDVSFEWDPEKAARTLLERGIDFRDAIGVFDDPID
jgi:hypothetical protein